MKLTFVQFPAFVADRKHFRLIDEDLQALEQSILKNPEEGAVMAGTGGLPKMRFKGDQ